MKLLFFQFLPFTSHLQLPETYSSVCFIQEKCKPFTILYLFLEDAGTKYIAYFLKSTVISSLFQRIFTFFAIFNNV